MMINRINNKKGLTLIEVLLAIVIAALVFGVAFSLQVFGLRSFGIGTTQAELQQQARLVDEVLRSELRNAVYLSTNNNNNAARELYFENGNINFGIDGQRSLNVGVLEEIEINQGNNGDDGNNNILFFTIRVNGYEFNNKILLNNYKDEMGSIGEKVMDGINNVRIYYSLPSDNNSE